jgi:hypothetical protein
MNDFIEIRNPRLENSVAAQNEYPTLKDLSGKTMVVLNNRWAAMDEIVVHMSKLMKERYGIADVKEFTIPSGEAPPDALFHEAVKAGDFALVGLAN